MESTGHRCIPLKKASDPKLEVFFDLCLNKRLSKQSIRRWYETPPGSLWRHCNMQQNLNVYINVSEYTLSIQNGSYLIRWEAMESSGMILE